jgi:hypothetical protein
MAFMRKKTAHGHIMAEVYSCFQKYVRRGDADDALYWGAQIGRTDGAATGYPNALKKRLMQHALEDVGHVGYALALNATKAKTWEALVPWIHALCALSKTRAAAWMNRVAVQYVADAAAAPTPLLTAAAEVLVKHRDERLAELETQFGKPALRLYKELNNEVLVFHCLLLEAAGVVKPATIPALGAAAVDAALLDTPREVPDFALDKHTARGKRMGRGYAHFLDTMVVAPRLFAGEDEPFEVAARSLYKDGKEQRVRHLLAASAATAAAAATGAAAGGAAAGGAGAAAAAVNPLAGCTEILQAQLLTGKHKPRVWFATRDGKQLVIKGPVKAAERAANLASEALKEKLGLPRTNLHEEGEYLVMDSLIDYTKLETRVVSSKLESDVRVPVAAEMPVWESAMLENPALALGVMKGLLFRKIAGANDTCARNFVVAGGDVYSIDDAAIGATTAHMWKKALVREKAAYATALRSVWSELKATMRDWRALMADNPSALAQLQLHRKRSRWAW